MHTHAPASVYSLDNLADDELHASTCRLVAGSNQLLAALLAHLGEVEARGIHRERACASLYTYCIYELRMSEDAAFRRARAAKVARQFPVLFEQIAAGEIHLTGVLLLAPLLTQENHLELLARAKHRTKKEIALLVRSLSPLPDVLPIVEPLGPAQGGAGRGPATWSRWMQALCPIRELPPGGRPRDWMAENASESRAEVTTASEEAGESTEESTSEPMDESSSASAGPAKPEPVPQRYRVQFTATQEYVDLLEEAKDLLAHTVRSPSLDELHLRAMRALVSELRKRKYAVTENVRTRAPKDARGAERAGPRGDESADPRGDESADPRSDERPDPRSDARADPRSDARADEGLDFGASDLPHQEASTPAGGRDGATTAPLQRGRYVPAAVRRAVWARDGERCSYVDACGQRCREKSGLELHHDAAYALGGPPTESNLCLRCKAHNDLAAEHDFGRDFMACKKGVTLPHEVIQELPP
jgi:hypothetical protein